MRIEAERVAIVVTEACTNLLKHASGGEILLRSTGEDGPDAPQELEVLALDQGPGMANPGAVPARTASARAVLPARVWGRSCASPPQSDFYSDVTRGTALLARWSARASNGGTAVTHTGAAYRRGQRMQTWPGSLRRLLGRRSKPKMSALLLGGGWLGPWSRSPGRVAGGGPDAASEPAASAGRAARPGSSGAAQFAGRGRERGAHRSR